MPEALQGIRKATNAEIEGWRLRQGLPIGSGELSGDTNPFELGLSNLVDMNKGCYLGQETMAKLSRVGSLKQELRFWESEENVSQGDNLISNCSDQEGHKPAGIVTS